MNRNDYLGRKETAERKRNGQFKQNECKLLNKSLICPIQFPSAIHAQKQVMNGNRIHHRIEYRYLAPCVLKGTKERDNIAWDKWPEDVPFTQEAFYTAWREAKRVPNKVAKEV